VRRPWLSLGVVSAVALLGGQVAGPAVAADSTPAAAHSSHANHYPADSLRALAARVGLRIGTAVNPDLLGTNAKYTQITAEQFSSLTPENAMKWESVEPTRGTYTWAQADKVVAFAEAHKQLVRGHTLVWHSQLPKWLSPDGSTSTFSSDELKAILKKHIQDEAGRYRGRIWQWDVVNEAFNDDGTPRQTVWYKAWGNSLDYIADAFRWAHQADPHALLFYNDYNIESTAAKSNAVYAFIKQLKAQGVPIDGVGFQNHLDTQYGFPDLQNNLQRFADLGLKVAITEADVRTFTQSAARTDPDYQVKVNTPISPLAQYAQEDFWSRSLQACLAVRQCISFTAWGFGDAYSWVQGVFTNPQTGAALLYDVNLNPKPQYFVLQQDLALAAGAPHRTGRGAGRD
jgi:endo-1,4-beta-xylanase